MLSGDTGQVSTGLPWREVLPFLPQVRGSVVRRRKTAPGRLEMGVLCGSVTTLGRGEVL